ncbi:hypothetical protein DUI87_24503 [Hirundo rustica rustica]|uniref:Uncharacterized protein n=1 Tax=Hirundo rustica rustica TaxID=333673 RepID=A0A3M0JDL2_HIRRU|nr:hypothetical protein DUI87_24503 [Hirundo rustica rustica]
MLLLQLRRKGTELQGKGLGLQMDICGIMHRKVLRCYATGHSLFSLAALAMLRFGQHLIKPSVVFLRTELCFALVNRRPVVPGRILSMADPGKSRTCSGRLEGQAGKGNSLPDLAEGKIVCQNLLFCGGSLCGLFAVGTGQTDSSGCEFDPYCATSKGFGRLVTDLARESSNFNLETVVEIFGKS